MINTRSRDGSARHRGLTLTPTLGQRFVRADLDRLASLAVPAALAIEHSRLYEELQARVRELEATQAQLLQAGKLSAVGQLVSGVAHELNNPLSVILGYAQLLSARDLPAELRRPVEMIQQGGHIIQDRASTLFLFRSEEGRNSRAVDAEAIEQPLSLRATQLMLSGVRVSATYGEGVPAAEGDAHQLQQVFLNLILNAEQAILGSRVGGQRVGDAIRVTTGVRVDQGQTWVVITVGDNGPGIPRDALPRIFEPFFTTKKVGEGTGLGLSVSYGIIQQHGGRLSVESRPGHTVFTIELPAAASRTHAGREGAEWPAHGVRIDPRSRGGFWWCLKSPRASAACSSRRRSPSTCSAWASAARCAFSTTVCCRTKGSVPFAVLGPELLADLDKAGERRARRRTSESRHARPDRRLLRHESVAEDDALAARIGAAGRRACR